MSRSKLFRVSIVRGDGNGAHARNVVPSYLKKDQVNRSTNKCAAETSHEVKVVEQSVETTAECLECDFKIEPNSDFIKVLFAAEKHGRITKLVCDPHQQESIMSWIRVIREGLVTRK